MEFPGGKNLLFFAFHRGKKAGAAAREICDVYGEGVIGESCAKFKNGDFELNDTPRSGRPSEFDEERLNRLSAAKRYRASLVLCQKCVEARWRFCGFY
ncbi:hypothetical protein WH47_09228 [Habropoda laboriosa]|uniref:Mos1 transposase HTH domain-containing protein n=1 Tax=Habropoda laboriosa TaxID=597456 RepID=A0A0L7QNW6_9HYME|nr:hypothetical protein WH47_09228 [Habropoda laboriosa]